VVTRSYATVDAAHAAMIAHGVRALFVVDEHSIVLGILTSTDVLAERPIQVAQERGVRHSEVLVREVMTPANLLEAIDLEEVLHAHVGDVVASLRRSGRQHALVVESAPADAASPTSTVRGIFSLTQIARQLGLPPQTGHDIARTFAEIESAIGA
jgi:CBS-domain-containing membrane protein